ncbi:heme ABC transporter ATP-binding protein [Methylobrevis pamukkalensis]|uniref:Hemin import ATP-binding protein HmuV n=1 Tax=Methylobrevis pamukkalensis TaxID=1439726 RepID=A0A1E3H4L0_9HYPH|nr:heme ABC transporter ATP-binding protein [Methylobrevis pamukkalensis]ODN71085.1 Hemin import ATP-binding protein HmuV [Methylobrevis pamukkalensis]
MIDGRDLVFAVRDRRLVDRVSLAVAAGTVTIVVGPNGAGKSTLLRLLAGDLAPTSGRVTLDGTDLARLSPSQLAGRRAVLPQQVALAFPFTVDEVVRLGADAGRRHVLRRSGAGEPGPSEADLVETVLAEVGLPGWGGRLYPQLSGGEQQRVQFARVLAQVHDPVVEGPDGSPLPRLLFLDEPTASLDIRHQIDLLARARRWARGGGAVLAVIHDLNLAAEFADRIVVLSGGTIAAEGPPAATLTDAVVARVFGLSGIVGRLPPPHLPYILPQARL